MNFQDEAHGRLKANHDDETAWEKLTYGRIEHPRIQAGLSLLSEGTIGDRLAWHNADGETRREMVDRILLAGGVPTFDDKWVELG